MALNIPQILASFTHKDTDTQRLYDNTGKAVNPLLGFVRSTFTTLANGVLRVLPDVQVTNFTATGNAQISGASTVNGRLTANGDTYANGRVVAVKSGYKAFIPMGFYYNGAYTVATGYVQTVQFTQSTSGTNFLMANLAPTPFNGSLVGITALYYGQGGTIPCNVQIRGIAATPTLSFSATSQPFSSQVAYTRGAYPIVANQGLTAWVSFGTAGNNLLYIGAIVEWDT